MINNPWQKVRKYLWLCLPCLIFPVIALLGVLVFPEKAFAFVTLAATILATVPMFVRFERGKADAGELVLIAAMTALSVVGRMAFSPVPGFKPVTAMAVITAMYFGSEAGFLTGALSAVISNFYFGQGPWTPFQMFSWGILGLIAGFLADQLKKNRWWLLLFGAFSGILYSLLMDVYTVLWADGYFNIKRYLAAIFSSAYFTAVYAVSNVVFLLLFAKPIGKVLDRIKSKFF